jgi:hypothetical protein
MFGWLKLKLYAAFALIGAGLVAAIYVMGGKSEKNKRMKSRLDGMKNKQEVENEVDNRNDDELIAGIVRKRR